MELGGLLLRGGEARCPVHLRELQGTLSGRGDGGEGGWSQGPGLRSTQVPGVVWPVQAALPLSLLCRCSGGHIGSPYYIPGTVGSTLHALANLILLVTLRERGTVNKHSA